MNYIQVMNIIVSFFKNPELFFKHMIKGKFGELMAKYYSLDILLQFNKYANVSKILRPDAVLQILKRANQQERNALLEDIKRMNEADKKKAIDSLDLSQQRTKLSSSWVQYGSFQQYKGSTLGNLTIWVKSDKDKKQRWYGPYTYPAIKNSVWLEMTYAKGKNGTGAGSVMWRMFLREWLPSQLRDFVNRNKSVFNQQSLSENQQLIKDLTSNFARRKTGLDTRNQLKVGKESYKTKVSAERRKYNDAYLTQKEAINERYKQKLKEDREKALAPYNEAKKRQREEYAKFKQMYSEAPAFVKTYVNTHINSYNKAKRSGQTTSFGTFTANDIRNTAEQYAQMFDNNTIIPTMTTNAKTSNSSSTSNTSTNNSTSNSSASTSSSGSSASSSPTNNNQSNQSNKPKPLMTTNKSTGSGNGNKVVSNLRNNVAKSASKKMSSVSTKNVAPRKPSSSKSTSSSSARTKSTTTRSSQSNKQGNDFSNYLLKKAKRYAKKALRDIWNQK